MSFNTSTFQFKASNVHRNYALVYMCVSRIVSVSRIESVYRIESVSII
jgi:hypothetical protein